MNSQERVHAALRREPVDRLPVYMWFHPQTTQRLAEMLEIPPQFVGDVMGNDVHQIWVNNNYAMEGIVHEEEGGQHTDDWGITWVRRFGFNQIETYPLAGASAETVMNYRFPYDSLDSLFAPMQALAQASEGYFLGCDVSPCAFEMYWRLRGMEDTFLDIAADFELARHMIRGYVDFSLCLAEHAMEQFPLDWLWTGDDVASQQGMLFSPGTWRRLVKPELARLFQAAKDRGLWVAYHCCGSLRPIIPDLIEIGLDVLNPIQSNCPGMDALELKRAFGHDLAFMGGVDTQGLLPNGTISEVRRATAALIEGMTQDGGGYILAASHTIPPETPDENIFAMYAEAGISQEEIFDRAAETRSRLKKK